MRWYDLAGDENDEPSRVSTIQPANAVTLADIGRLVIINAAAFSLGAPLARTNLGYFKISSTATTSMTSADSWIPAAATTSQPFIWLAWRASLSIGTWVAITKACASGSL